MMPQEEVSEAKYQQADPEYGRYEGNWTSSTRRQYETSNEQELKESLSGKVYPRQRDNANILRFTLALIALGLLLLFGVLFVVMIGGAVGWASFAVACFALFAIAGIGIVSLRPRG